MGGAASYSGRDMDEVEWWEFDTPAEMAEQVADDVAFVVESAIEAHGGARIASDVPRATARSRPRERALHGVTPPCARVAPRARRDTAS